MITDSSRAYVGTEDEVRFEQPEIFKRRAVSPGVAPSPTYGSSSPITIAPNNPKNGNGNASKRHSLIQDTHEVLHKMSLGASFGEPARN